MIEFRDRRPAEFTNVRLTRRQRELASNFGIGEVDEKGNLTVTQHGYRKVLEASHDMLEEAGEWGREYKGVRASAKNLNEKLQRAVTEAVVDNCPDCRGLGCRKCLGTRKRLR